MKLSGNNGSTSTYEVARFDEEHKVFSVDFDLFEQKVTCSCLMFEFEGILCRHVLAVFKATNIFMLPPHYMMTRWTRNAKDEAMLDVIPSVETHGNAQRGKNSQYNVLYQEAINCVEEGMASEYSFKVALSALREARIKILGAKKIAVNALKLETTVSTCYQDENKRGSQVDN